MQISSPGTLRELASLLNRYAAAIVFLVAACWLVLLAGGRPDINPDGANAIHMARNVAAGDGLGLKVVPLDDKVAAIRPMVTKPPVYAVSVSALMTVGLPARLSAWGIVVAAWAMAATFLFLLARKALPLGAALVVPLLFAVQFTNLRWGVTIHEQSLFVGLSYAVLWRLSSLESNREGDTWWPQMVTGLLTGLAMATSYQGLPLLVVATAFVALGAIDGRRWRSFLAYCSGVALIGAWPAVRFVTLWLEGLRPAFTGSDSPTYFKLLAGVASAFQNDFFGRQVVWLYDGSWSKLMVLAFFVLGLCGLAAHAWVCRRDWRPLVVFLLAYLGTLVLWLGGTGVPGHEPRLSMMSNGLILLFLVFATHRLLAHLLAWPWMRVACLATLVALFVGAQYVRSPELLNLHAAARGICPAPKTLAWIESNVPRNSVVATTQCGYELVANSADYYVVFIPPADSYTNNIERWNTEDFARLCKMSDSAWVMILGATDSGGREVRDPLLDKWGYGDVTDRLFEGQGPSNMQLAARLDDGWVYRVECRIGDAGGDATQ